MSVPGAIDFTIPFEQVKEKNGMLAQAPLRLLEQIKNAVKKKVVKNMAGEIIGEDPSEATPEQTDEMLTPPDTSSDQAGNAGNTGEQDNAADTQAKNNPAVGESESNSDNPTQEIVQDGGLTQNTEHPDENEGTEDDSGNPSNRQDEGTGTEPVTVKLQGPTTQNGSNVDAPTEDNSTVYQNFMNEHMLPPGEGVNSFTLHKATEDPSAEGAAQAAATNSKMPKQSNKNEDSN